MSATVYSSLCLLACLLLAGQVSAQGDLVECPNNGVNCKVCRKANSVNDISNMPHVNRKIVTVSNDYGYYDLFTCGTNPTSFGDCTFFEHRPKVPDSNVFGEAATSKDDPLNYIDSLAMYLVVAIFMCVFSFLCGLLLCIGRCCCCCINRGGTCGRRWPTRKTCWLGFEPNKTTREMEYSFRGRWGARIFMGIFVFCVILFICLGQFRGNQGFNTAMRAFVDAPDGMAALIQAQATPFVHLAQNVIGITLVQGLREINGTINDVVSLPQIAADADCIIDKILDLPSVDSLDQLLDTTISTVNNISATIQGDINTELLKFIAQKQLVVNEINDLKLLVRDVNATLAAILHNATAGSFFVGQIGTIFDQLKYEINFILGDLDKLKFLPPADEATQVSGANDVNDPYSLNQLLFSVPHPMTTAEAVGLQANLTRLNESYYSKLPDFNATADHMVRFNQLLDSIQQQDLIDQAENSINGTLAKLQQAVQVDAQVNATLARALSYARSFDFSGVINIINFANQTLSAFGTASINALRAQGDKILALSGVRGCVQDILDAITRFNQSIATLPSDLTTIKATLASFNDSLNTATSAVETYIEHGLDQYTNAVDVIDFAGIKAQIQRMKDQVMNATALLDVTTILNDIHNLTDVTIHLNVAQELANANASLSSNRISNGSVFNVRQLGLWMLQLKADLSILVPELPVYEAHPIQPRICDGSPFTTACSADTTCLAGQHCIVDQERLGRLIVNVYLTAGLPPVSDVITTLNTINSTIQIALNQVSDDLNNALNNLNNVDTGLFVSQIDSLTNGILNFDPNSTLSQFNNIYNIIGTLDFSSARAEIQNLNSSFQELQPQLHRIEDLRNSSKRIEKFLFTDLPHYLDELSVGNLQTIYNQQGVSGMVLYVANILDTIIMFVNQTASPYVNFGYNLADQVSDKTELLDAFTTNYPVLYGSIQYGIYLADVVQRELLNQTGMTGFLSATDPRGANGRFNEDGNGDSYVNPVTGEKQMCLTRNCLYNTADYFTKRSVKDLSNGQIALNLTPEQVAGLPYLIPFFICLFGTLAVILGMCLKGSAGTSWAACCSNLTACMIFCQMPGIFLFAGAFFIIPLAMGDFCFGIENVGAQLINRMGDNICEATGSQFNVKLTGTAQSCVYNYTASGYNIPFVVSVPDAYKALFGACDAFAVDPLKSIYDSVATRVKTIPYERLGDLINGTSNPFGQGITIQGPVMGVLTDIANNAGLNMVSFVYDVSNSIGCGTLGAVYTDVKNAMCCDTVGAIYWVVASWYLIGWSFILCGCWASLFGRKRFGSVLWGPEIQKHDVLARSQPHAEFDDPEPLAVDDHAPPLEGGSGKTMEPVGLQPMDASAADGEFVAQKEGNTDDHEHNSTG